MRVDADRQVKLGRRDCLISARRGITSEKSVRESNSAFSGLCVSGSYAFFQESVEVSRFDFRMALLTGTSHCHSQEPSNALSQRSARILTALIALIGCAVYLQAGEPTSIVPGHNLLSEEDLGDRVRIGDVIDSLSFRDVNGEAFYLSEASKHGTNGFCVHVDEMSTCKTLHAAAKAYARNFPSKTGVSFIAVFPNRDESTRRCQRSSLGRSGTRFKLVRDVHGYVAQRVGATMTPQAFVDGHRCKTKVSRRDRRSSL